MKKKTRVAVAPKKKEYSVPNARLWSIITTLLLIMTLFWHVQAVSGWLNGKTMVEWYGMDTVLADAIAACPDILFYSTYFAMGVSVIMLVITAVVLYRYVVDEMEGYDALNITTICSLIAVWAFPIIHVAADLTASALQIRDTSGFDVFQLDIAGLPLLVISAVCVAVLWVNRSVMKNMA